MKRITKKEAEQLQKTRLGYRSRVRGELEGIQVGKALAPAEIAAVVPPSQ
jgi:succinate dehydrogenase flavin-adding protein (antitoxin of CptAB toxin-antitoxin module)